jgi:hypothetical protein
MTLVYFGAPWDTPTLDGTLQAETPVGRPCNHCGELIVRGDRGIIEITDPLSNDPAGREATHVHAECQLDDTAGQLIGLCVCRATPGARARAREAWTHFYNPDGTSVWPQTTSH